MRKNPTPPSYRLHKPTGQGVVTLDGRDYYCGCHNTPDSRREYHRLIGQWSGNDGNMPAADAKISELVLRFLKHAKTYYVDRAGRPNGEYDNYLSVARPLRHLYGRTYVRDFGPVALKAVRNWMVAAGWARSSINRQISRVRHIFRWAHEHELCHINVWLGLKIGGRIAGREIGRPRVGPGPPGATSLHRRDPTVCFPAGVGARSLADSDRRACRGTDPTAGP